MRLLNLVALGAAQSAPAAWTYDQHGADWAAGGFPFCAGAPSSSPARAQNQWQSPIELPGLAALEPDTNAPPVFSTAPLAPCTPTRITNGHTWEVQFNSSGCSDPPAHSLAYARRRYHLTQYHFHSGSEHTVASSGTGAAAAASSSASSASRSDMELHLVHVDDLTTPAGTRSNLVLGVLLKLAAAGETPDLDAASLAALPQDPYAHFIAPSAGSDYYAYEGSMTTPDCQSAVQWLVLSRPLTVSTATLAAFIASVGPGRTDGVPSQAVACAMPGHAFCTYRSAQPLNNRTITTGTLASAMRTGQS